MDDPLGDDRLGGPAVDGATGEDDLSRGDPRQAGNAA
jgi:hypothetical protein